MANRIHHYCHCNKVTLFSRMFRLHFMVYENNAPVVNYFFVQSALKKSLPSLRKLDTDCICYLNNDFQMSMHHRRPDSLQLLKMCKISNNFLLLLFVFVFLLQSHTYINSDDVCLDEKIASKWEHCLPSNGPPPKYEFWAKFYRVENTFPFVYNCGVGVCLGVHPLSNSFHLIFFFHLYIHSQTHTHIYIDIFVYK